MRIIIIIALMIALTATIGPMREAGRQSRLEEKQGQGRGF